MMTRKSSFLAVLCLVTLLGLVSLAGAANEVFLSTDTAQSEATYVIQFEATVKGNIDKIKIKLPSGANPANAVLGRVMVKDKVDEDDGEHKKDVKLSVDPGDSDTLIVDLHDSRSVKPGTEIRVELFNLNNPVAGTHAIDVSTIGKKGNVLEVIPSIAYSTFSDATQLTAGAGISISGSSPNFTITNTGDTDSSDDITSLVAGPGISITGAGNSRTITNTGDTNPADDITSLVGQDGITISGAGNSRNIGRDINIIQTGSRRSARQAVRSGPSTLAVG